MGKVDLRRRRRGMGEEGLQVAMHPFPQVGYVLQHVGAGGFGEKTEVGGNDDGAVDEGELEDPIREEEREEGGAGDLFCYMSE